MEKVSVIIPTVCEAVRADSLHKAIDSALSQRDVRVELILVVNGRRYDAALLERLRADSRLRVVYVETPGAPSACRHGRSIATGAFFTFLDDDDELLPDALRIRLAGFAAAPDVDFIVTNGYRGFSDQPCLPHVDLIMRDPFAALVEQNWLASCGGLFRLTSCGDEFFADLPKYIEWTMVAYRLMLANRRVKFVDTPTYRVHDTPGSASKSQEFRLASVGVTQQLLALPLPAYARRKLKRRLLSACHDVSTWHLEQGNRAAAWKLHLQSLAGLSGLKYLPYTRRLL